MHPPADRESETMVIAYLVGSDDDPGDKAPVLNGLDASHFADRLLRLIFEAIVRLAADGIAPDTASVAAALHARGETTPNHAELTRLVLDNATAKSAALSARHVLVELRQWRVLLELGEHWRAAYQRGGSTVPQLVAQALVDMEALLREQVSDTASLGVVMRNRVAELKAAEGKPVRRTPTGFAPLDNLVGGFGQSDLVVLAGATGGGKSALAEHVLAEVASSGRRVLVASAEMQAWELADRLLSRVSFVPAAAIRDNRVDTAQLHTLGLVADAPVWDRAQVIERRGSLHVQRIAQVARDEVRKGELGLIIVDYLQLISAIVQGGEKRSRQAEVAAVARGLKNLAMDLSVPVLALSQFNREGMREGEEPELYHLRESGEIEQAANIVLFVWEHPADKNEPDIRRLICKKHRAGAVNIATRLRWSPKTLTFSDARAGVRS